ncbi:hypothetical protein AQUCO_09600024v1 [Aquilegia coerulea]|uniref:Uncharacterized protein n=1 Tax=Aquilegia coerulea TaxID=218851 RepID=A0A2G5C5V0_AQUCA|nr:hypothetical protein AQUCO_09600024v1 [Aquilegia coerulea]
MQFERNWDELFFNKLLSRDTSKGFSSHIFHRQADGVPFKWETQPGTPINPHIDGSIPPLSPPPAAHAHTMFINQPCSNSVKKKTSRRTTIWFWKKSKKIKQSKDKQIEMDTSGLGQVENFEFWSSDMDSVYSLQDSNSSSYSESASFDDSSSPSSKRSKSPKMSKRAKIHGLDWGLSRTPWNLTGFMICVSRKG